MRREVNYQEQVGALLSELLVKQSKTYYLGKIKFIIKLVLMTPTNKKAVIYTRVSTKFQAENGFGLAGQLEKCRNICKLKGYEVVKEYTDEGVSGTTEVKTRKGFNSLLENLDGVDILVILGKYPEKDKTVKILIHVLL